MKLPSRPVMLALLALAAPLPALAVSGDDAPAGPAALSVSTTLGECGATDAQVVCQLNVSFNELESASSYSASVTRVDGSVVDYGSVPAGGTSLWVPYVGAGSYSVTVTAYGTPEGPGEPQEKIATEVSDAETETDEAKLETQGESGRDDAEAEVDAPDEPDDPNGGQGPADAAEIEGADETCTEQAPPAPPAPPIPPEPQAPPADADPNNPDEDADGVPDASEAAEYERLVAEREEAIAAAEAAELPDSIDC
jgi:hypothetical protein